MTADHRASRTYRTLLLLAPRRLRARHAHEMQELFAASLHEARTHGRAATARVWTQAVWDLLAARAREPFRTRSVTPLPDERNAFMLGSDLRYTFRWLGRQKFSTALVVSMLSLGIAANVVVFSLINGLFLRPFPFEASERLVYVNETAPKWNLEVVGINYPDFHQWRQSVKLFDGIALWEERAFNFSDGRAAERLNGAAVTHEFPAVLRIAPRIGRLFTADDEKPGAVPVVIIGEGVWLERFSAAPDVLGRTLKLDGVTRTIVGVVPAIASWPGNIRLWVPLTGDPAQPWQSYGFDGVVGRLKPGVTVEDAEKDLLRAQEAIWNARDKEKTVSPYARSLRSEFARGFKSQAKTLLVGVAILLFVACANVASVMLARALLRRREMGIRLAIGASRARLARQLFAENIVLSVIGGSLGLAVGYWALRILVRNAGDQIPAWASFGLDWRVAAFTLAVTLGTALLFGLAPALHAIRGNLRAAVHAATAGTTAGPGGRRTLSLLVGAEFALAAILLICAGLLLRAYDRVRSTDPGFRVDGVVTFSVALPDAAYGDREGRPEGERSQPFWDRLEEGLRSLPGVAQAGLVSCAPLGCHWGTFFRIEGRRPLAPGEANPVTLYRPATPSYFETMGIRLKSGRFFTDHDGRDKNLSIIVNETFVKTFWPGVTDPIGRRIKRNEDDAPWMTVVGYVEDVRHYGLERPMRPGVYLPLRQAPSTTMTVAIRTSGSSDAVLNDARAAIRRLDPDLALYRVRTMQQALDTSLLQRRLYSWLIGVFSALALVLALGGTYGVTSYLVSQRTREMGIRVALGARTADITRTVLRSSLAVIIAGVAVGIASAVAVARLMAELLFGVPPHDAVILAAAGTALLAFAVAANWLPARRAARVDPMLSLRAE